jgi:hypothetical protein
VVRRILRVYARHVPVRVVREGLVSDRSG